MDNAIVQAVADHAETVLGKEGFHYISAVVANCKMLTAELEEHGGDISTLDMDALVIAAYLHNISTAEYGFTDHHLKSAEMAVEFLRKHDVPARSITKVEQIILTHTKAIAPDERESAFLDGVIEHLSDATPV